MGEPTKYLDEDAVAALLSVSVRTVQRWRVTGDGPPFIRAGARRVIYHPTQVNAWAAARTFKHHAEELTREAVWSMAKITETPARGLAAGLGISSSVGTGDGPERAAVAQAKNNRTVDFRCIGQAAVSSLPAILARIVPGGQIIGAEYVVRNPARADHHLGSFKINLQSGKWADFATGDRGGDVVSLVAYLEGTTQFEAARLLAQMLGTRGSR